MSNLREGISVGLLVLVAGGFIAFSTQAGESSPHGPPPFSDFDLDSNGFVSEEEFNKARGERMAARAAEGKQMHGAATAPSFADIDTDADGQLNPEELSAAQKAHMEKRHGHHKHKGQGSGCGKGKGMRREMPTFSDFDLNGDGKIVETEFNQGHAERMSKMAAEGRYMKHAGDAPGFSGVDSDGNGEITEKEFAAHQDEYHQKMHNCKN
jgi:Ca2+-binding EF-hand superfamily protein